MFRWLYIIPYLIHEAGASRPDARIRFLNAQVEILRRKLGGNRVIPSTDDRARLLATGSEFNHEVAGVIGIVTHSRPILGGWLIKGKGGSLVRSGDQELHGMSVRSSPPGYEHD